MIAECEGCATHHTLSPLRFVMDLLAWLCGDCSEGKR